MGDLFSVQINEKSSIGAWDIALIVAVVVVGPLWAALAALPSALLVGRLNPLRTLYEVGHSITIVFLSGIVFSFASEPLMAGDSESLATILYGTVMAGVVLTGTSESINAVMYRIKYEQSFRETWRDTVQPYLSSDFINVLTAGLGVLAFVVYGPVAAVVVVAGSVGSQVLVYRSREQVKENRELRARVSSLEEALMTSNTTFGTMIVQDLGRRDGYTDRHAAATAVYAQDIAREMKLDEGRAGRLRMAGLLHNVGLFGMPDEILSATGRLNSIAKSKLDEHPVLSERALAAIPEFADIAGWVRWHHERPDGRGYPDRLIGAWIPTEAKVLGVAQAYASMVLDGPSRPALPPGEARRRLVSGVDTEFDGAVVRAFLRILDTENEGYRMADDGRFAFPSPGKGDRPDRAEHPGLRAQRDGRDAPDAIGGLRS